MRYNEAMPEISGDLSVMPLSDVVIWLANRSMSGTLQVERQDTTKSFEIVDGQAIRAASNDPREYFGQFLVHSGKLTEDQLQRAFQTQNETKVLLGRILVMIGIVPEEQVIQSLRVKVSESLLDTFRWKDGRFRFESGGSNEDRPQIELAIDLSDIHAEGLARSEMWGRYNRIFPDGRFVLAVNEDAPAAAAPPDTLPGRILSLARHGLSIEAITLDLHATDYQLASRLLELHREGAISPQEPTGTLLPLSGSTMKAHVAKAREALEAERYSVALRYVDEAARLPGHDEELESLRQELSSHRGASPAELQRSSVPVLVKQPEASDLRRLSAKQRYVLARIDGQRSVESIIQVSPMHDREALEILHQFEADRLIELR
jgi:hypothetical protein